MKSIWSTFLLDNSPQFLYNLNPNELAAFRVFAKATSSLNQYLTDPLAQNPKC